MFFVRVLTFLKVFGLCLLATACAQGDRAAGFGAAAADIAIISSANGEHRIKIELADDNEERRVGLMYREELAAGTGMLFDFGDPQPVSMWMKNTLIPLDMPSLTKLASFSASPPIPRRARWRVSHLGRTLSPSLRSMAASLSSSASNPAIGSNIRFLQPTSINRVGSLRRCFIGL